MATHPSCRPPLNSLINWSLPHAERCRAGRQLGSPALRWGCHALLAAYRWGAASPSTPRSPTARRTAGCSGEGAGRQGCGGCGGSMRCLAAGGCGASSRCPALVRGGSAAAGHLHSLVDAQFLNHLAPAHPPLPRGAVLLAPMLSLEKVSERTCRVPQCTKSSGWDDAVGGMQALPPPPLPHPCTACWSSPPYTPPCIPRVPNPHPPPPPPPPPNR